MWQNGILDVSPPELPSPQQHEHEQQRKRQHRRPEVFDFYFSLATANVQSLYRGPLGHAGKLHYLQAQMRSHGLHCLALQEARTNSGLSCNQDILRIATGQEQGQFGLELWIDLERPYAYNSKNKAKYFSAAHFQVVHSEPKRLLVKCDTGTWAFWLFNFHAPHGGHSPSDRQQWWTETADIIQRFGDECPLFVMADANAAPGERDDRHVFSEGFTTSANTKHFRTFLQDHDLALPATSRVHQGSNVTWINFDGTKGHVIDHIAIPCAWSNCCTHSQIIEDFDLANLHDDHKVAAVQLQWRSKLVAEQYAGATTGSYKPCVYHHDTEIQEEIARIAPLPWKADVEQQALHLTHSVREVLQRRCKNTQRAKKCYVDEMAWTLRFAKIWWKRRLTSTRRRIAEQSLSAVFRAWRSSLHGHTDQQTLVLSDLFCHQVKQIAAFHRLRLELKKYLQKSKQRSITECLSRLDASTSAAEILKSLRQFTGPTNPKKAKARPIPMIRDEQGEVCKKPEEALNVWVNFFQQMEGGVRMTRHQLRKRWIQELHHFQQDAWNEHIGNLPSLTDLEIALRRVPKGRACGPDGVPGEVCHHQAVILAKHLYPQLLKMYLHGQEHIGFKGGCLVPAYKGKGPTDTCASYRSLLVSNQFGKVLHRSIRQKTAGLYESFLQLQQTGGRRHVPVQLAVHQLRAFIRQAHESHRSTGVLYLDLTEAFYRIVRELPIGGEIDDLLVAHILHKLQMPAEAMQDLHRLLQEPSALAQAGLSATEQRCIQAIHTGTHFWLRGQSDISRTRIGSRPGDSFADVIFGYAWCCVLKKLQDHMQQIGALTHLQGQSFLPLFGRDGVTQEQFPFLGPNWMDDLALCFEASSSEGLVSKASCVTSYLLDLCAQHCMSPNLAKGKTELLFTFRGPRSREYKRTYYGPAATGSIALLCESGVKKVQLVARYRHLGGITHHSGDQQVEIRQRIAIAHAAMTQHRKVLFQNRDIPLTKRAELFQMLVLSKILYGAESWIFTNAKTAKVFHVAIMNLYRRLARFSKDGHFTDEEILTAVMLPSPEELLRRTRLRYFVTLVKANLPDVWSLLALDVNWCKALEQDFEWMWSQLQRSSHLPDPKTGYEQWLLLAQISPGYWKRLVRRACEHSMGQRRRVQQVKAFHLKLIERIGQEIPDIAAYQPEKEDDSDSHYGCMLCQIRCRSLAGEAAHMRRTHNQVSELRQLFDQTSCSSCLKEYHTMQKLKAHLYYSTACRERLISQNMQCEIMPGAGSADDGRRAQVHDRLYLRYQVLVHIINLPDTVKDQVSMILSIYFW